MTVKWPCSSSDGCRSSGAHQLAQPTSRSWTTSRVWAAARSSRLAGLYIIPFAGIAFIWFMAPLRDRIVQAGGREHAVLSAVQLISGMVFVAALFAVGAAEAVHCVDGRSRQRIRPRHPRHPRGSLRWGRRRWPRSSPSAPVPSSSPSAAPGRCGLACSRWSCYAGLAMALALLFVATTWRPMVVVVPPGCWPRA
jgi:hypothetical protein